MHPTEESTVPAWQARQAQQDPRYNNGAFALQHYAAEAPIGSGIHDSPGAIGATDLGFQVAGKGGKGGMKAGSPTAAPQASPASGIAALLRGNPNAGLPASTQTQASKKNVPTIGTTEDGYIFTGGDPSNKANWVKASDVAAGVAQ